MFAFPASLRIYVAVEPVDMRKQFNGLWAHAEQALGENPKSYPSGGVPRYLVLMRRNTAS